MLEARLFDKLASIDPEHWDSILDQNDFFHRYDFIRVIEESKVENATLFYLLLYDKGQLVGTTVFSAFYVNLDLFISKGAFVRGLKKIFPRLFRIKLLACGLPASFGQLNLKLVDENYAGEAAALIAGEMKKLAKKLQISLMTIKEFRAGEKDLFRDFEDHGFFAANSIPYMNLGLKWNSFEEYLSTIRHPYRRRIRLSQEKIKQHASFELKTPGENDAGLFYQMYLAVMERTTVKLETLNLEFFKNLFENGNELKMLSLVIKGEIISSALLHFSEKEMTFILAGRVEEKDPYDSYFNLVYKIMALGMEAGVERIKMGQTSYWVKQCIGAEAEPEHIYFGSRRPLIHRILRSMRNTIFPEMKLKTNHVFRAPAMNTKHPVPNVYEYSE